MIKKIIDLTGNDSWRIVNEIEKISAYKGSAEVTNRDVELLVASKIDPNIFNLIDAMAMRNRLRSLELLYQELKLGRDPYYVLTMIIYQFRNIIAIKDLQKHGLSGLEISRKAKINPFVVQKILKSPFKIEEAISIYEKLLWLDTGFKSSQINLEDQLYKLAFVAY